MQIPNQLIHQNYSLQNNSEVKKLIIQIKTEINKKMIDDTNCNHFEQQFKVNKEDLKKTHANAQDDVSQYLNLGDLNFEPNFQDNDQTFVQPIKPQPDKKPSQEDQNQLIKPTKKRSSFHNFQKHIVITIRSAVDISLLGQDPQIALCQKNIWKAFKKSNKINKTLVSMVVGDLTQEQKSKIYQYGFKDIIRQFTFSQIRKAQHNIYLQVMRQLNTVNLQQKLIKRRMKYKKQFIVYFRAFLQQLVKGELDKRMTKCTKLLKTQNS